MINHADQIRLSKQLRRDANTPLGLHWTILRRDPDPEVLLGFLKEMEFRTLTRRIADKLGVDAP